MRIISAVGVYLFICSYSSAYAGPYVGLGTGPDVIVFNQNSQTYKQAPQGFGVSNNTHLAGIGAFGTLFIGYDLSFSSLDLAVEASAHANSADFNTANNEFMNRNFSASRYRLNRLYGISVLLGYQLFNSLLFYGRVGYVGTKLKINTSDTSLKNIVDNSKGIRVGLGIKQALTQRFSMRIDYSVIQYTSAKIHTIDPLSLVTKNTRIRPNQQLMELGVVVHM